MIITASSKSDFQISKENAADTGNIILNHEFSDGLHFWRPNYGCDAFMVPADSGCRNGLPTAIVSKRNQYWHGLEQDITSRISAGSTYTVSACVGASGTFQGCINVLATLKLVYQNSKTSFLSVGKKSVSNDGWGMLEGSFSLSTMPKEVIFYLEGPPPRARLLVKSVVIPCSSSTTCDESKDLMEKAPIITAYNNLDFQSLKEYGKDAGNIILNHDFSYRLHLWHPNCCDAFVVPATGYRDGLAAVVTNRKECWQGLEQNITSRVSAGSTYVLSACVGASGTFQGSVEVLATLKLLYQNSETIFMSVGKKSTSKECWEILEGLFSLSSMPDQVIFYLEGPPSGADLLIKSVVITCSSSTASDDADFGVNIITNTNLTDGTNGWFPLENCTMSVQTGSPLIIPPMARDSLGANAPLSGRYILVTDRTQNWMGPAQMITDKVKLYLPYQVFAWIKIGQASGPQRVKVALAVDGQWVNGGQVEISDGKWHEIGGSFRIAKQPAEVIVCIQGPAAGVDLMVAGLQIFPVDRRARFSHLKNQTAKIRKRDVIVKFSGLDSGNLLSTFVTVRQEKTGFPFGSAINRTYMDNEDFNDFFVKTINWGVLDNEVKWYWTEPQQGNFNYKDGNDFLVEDCSDAIFPFSAYS
ncbi:endo-1,4-beta-xylanase 1-like [Nicotiana sylvestris]|uniref:Uncharacterized protein LOC104234729 n=1 Tax=Nicotiana sylvestris TaxID=4096 RepID=A0A1U7X3E3_NICSY|nr:PREDICTED: uncharacterized protein LOC104234729 [Nicotiana sylvestris]